MASPLAFPATRNCDQGVETGESSDGSSDEVHDCLIIEETVEEVETISVQYGGGDDGLEVLTDVDKGTSTWIDIGIHAKAVMLMQKTKKVRRVLTVCRVLPINS